MNTVQRDAENAVASDGIVVGILRYELIWDSGD